MSAGNSGKLALSEKVYDFAKESATIYIPALGVLYVAIAAIWGLPHATEVAGTDAAVVTFLGVILKISNASYNANGGSADGTVNLENGYPSKVSVDLTPEQLSGKDSIVLNVVPTLSPLQASVQTPAAATENQGSPMTPGTFSQ